MDLDHTSRGCKGHLRHITTLTISLPDILRDPLLILYDPCLLLDPFHLNTMPNQLLIHFKPVLSHNLSGMHLLRGGGPSTTLLLLFFLHHLLNHNHCLLLQQGNPKCPPSRNRTQTTDRLNKYIVGNNHTQHMLWRFRRLTCDLGRLS